jgi:hypothetical protein
VHVQQLFDRDSLISLVSTHSVLVFKGDNEYPLLFFSQLIPVVVRITALRLEVVDVFEQELVALQPKFETSFLGMPSLFWLRSYHLLEEKKKKHLRVYLEAYKGPNILMLFVGDEAAFKPPYSIEVPGPIDQLKMGELMHWYAITPSQAGLHMIQRLFKRHKTIALDAACMVMKYASLVGTGNQREVDEWLDMVLDIEYSLFALSSAFFAKQGRLFFGLWSSIHDHYEPLFWITFWSEQIWRAACFVRYAAANNMVEARKIGHRLPFSFMQKDWRHVNECELVAAHQFLYSADFALKNGSEVPVLELLYMKFMEGTFK